LVKTVHEVAGLAPPWKVSALLVADPQFAFHVQRIAGVRVFGGEIDHLGGLALGEEGFARRP